ncbi:MAG: nucleotide exchange factor GrpE [Phototrophicaceae bacterium]
MTSNRLVVEVVTQLIRRIEVLELHQTTVQVDLIDVDKQVKRLAKELYKTNLMTDANGSQAPNHDVQELLTQLQQDQATQQREAITEARLEVVKAFVPVIDAVEAGLHSGIRQLKLLQQTQPDATKLLAAWLNGQRLLHERLLTLLQAEGIELIKALGQTFDPYLHVAVNAVSLPDKPSNIIVKVERSGYIHGDNVLRFADVVVNRQN